MPDRDPNFLARVSYALGGFIYVYDLVERRNVFVSARWGETFGYSLEETRGAAPGELLERIIHPDDLEAVAAHHETLRSAADDSVHLLQYRVRSKSGEYVWVSSVDRPMDRDAQGRVVTIAGHAHDISAQREAEQARAEGEARFRAIVEHLPDGVIIADAQARVLQVNDAACAQLGYTREQLLSMRLTDFVAPEYQGRIRERLTAPSGTATARESAHVRADGTRVPVETVVVAIELDGQPAYLGVARDISDRLQLEAQLRDAQRMEAIGRLAGSVAHDFNNILAAILGGATLLEKRPDGVEVQRVAREISAAASRGADLTRQLLTFGRRQPTEMRSLDVAEVVEHTLAVLRRLLDPAIELRTELTSGCVVRADRGMLDQVVMNLTLNARDAMPGGGTLTLRVGPALDAPDRVELLVSDTGSGIEPQDLPRVFEPFFSTKPSAEGTGIGLATVYGIVTQHDGTVTVDSAPGEGARFRVLLPCVEGPAERLQQTARPSASPSSRTILLLEDMEPVRNVIAQLLESQGHTVLQADTVAAARRLLAEHGVDLLLSDVALGEEQDGVDLALALQDEYRQLRVALMSGYPPEPERMRRLRHAVFLQKPFRLSQLDDALAKLWGGD